MNFKTAALLFFGMVFGSDVFAQPSAGFHLFKDKTSSKVVCAQYAFSPDWVRLTGGPFRDQGCKVFKEPKSAREDLPAVPPGVSPKK